MQRTGGHQRADSTEPCGAGAVHGLQGGGGQSEVYIPLPDRRTTSSPTFLNPHLQQQSVDLL